MSFAALKKPLAIAALFLVTITVAGVSLEIGGRIGYRSGLRVAELEAATRLRAEVEAASALRIGDTAQATQVLELGIDHSALRLLDSVDDPGVLAAQGEPLPLFALGAARSYRAMVPSPDPQAAGIAKRLASLPEVTVPSSPALITLHTQRAAQGGGSRPSTGVSIQGVDVDSSEGSIHVHYKTLRPLADCPGQQVEMNEVWKLVIDPRVHDSRIRTVVLWPEETLGRSASFPFTRDRKNEWCAQAPCLIRIAP